MTTYRQKTSHQERVYRKDDDTITISFKRFMCLRSIAEAVRVGDTSRLPELSRELLSLESKEYVKLLEPEDVRMLNYYCANRSNV